MSSWWLPCLLSTLETLPLSCLPFFWEVKRAGAASSPQMEEAREMPTDVWPSQGQFWFLPISLKEAQRESYTKLTCRKTHFLVALGKFNIKIGDKGMDIVVALYLQAEGRGEGQLFRLHSVNVHFLQPRGERKRRLTTSVLSGGPVTSPLEKLDQPLLWSDFQTHPPPSQLPPPSFLRGRMLGEWCEWSCI